MAAATGIHMAHLGAECHLLQRTGHDLPAYSQYAAALRDPLLEAACYRRHCGNEQIAKAMAGQLATFCGIRIWAQVTNNLIVCEPILEETSHQPFGLTEGSNVIPKVAWW